jgi:hypothetical protein
MGFIQCFILRFIMGYTGTVRVLLAGFSMGIIKKPSEPIGFALKLHR